MFKHDWCPAVIWIRCVQLESDFQPAPSHVIMSQIWSILDALQMLQNKPILIKYFQIKHFGL